MLIGIDGGGTKTALCLADHNGNVIGQITGLGSNPADLGIEEAGRRLTEQLNQLLAPFGGSEARFTSMYAGIAGSANTETSAALREIFQKALPNTKFIGNGSDAFNALYGESEDDNGISLISGTGSSCFALSDGEVHQIGGWGYLVDDAGSGFRVGADVLSAAYRAFDGRGEDTMLKDMCLEKLGLPFREAIPRIYSGGKRYIASFTYTAFEAYMKGDKIAKEIILKNAEALADHLKAGVKWIKRRPVICVVSGGLINNPNDIFFRMVQDALGGLKSEIQMIRPVVPPVYGALAKAARNAGIEAGSGFKNNFIKSYQQA